ncbi:MAG: cytochrome c biogenesis protein CcsA [bacterium]
MDILFLNLSCWGYGISLICYLSYLFIVKRRFAAAILKMLISLTIFSHALFFISRYMLIYFPVIEYKKYLPFNTYWEGLTLLALGIIVLTFSLGFFEKQRLVAAINLTLVLGMQLLVFNMDKYMPLIAPPYQTFWMSSYAFISLIGYSFLAISFICSLVYLALLLISKSAFLKRIFSKSKDLSLEELLIFNQRFVYFGFPLMCAGIILRSSWSNLAWGEWWQWNNEEIWSLIAWLLYMLFIYIRENKQNIQLFPAIVSLIAFVCGIISYFGHNIIGFNIFKNF